ncbi:hypothetical protein PRK78_005075 [Emydomyces testavorans]|uniref:Aminoglycoside phosphotransferase domain-containing protein n=1 Tax=Emydomyces testavorans TaxID=2070801 RepID=A0AAF0DLD3_9EURO|nr:hypothetical protein PRK78_005075 [Emydomyces testavorans]
MKMYSLENSIRSFFETQVSPNQQQCDELASSLVQGSVFPVPIQGSFSYTLSTRRDEDQKIVQFRVSHSALDLKTIQLAKEIHGNIVPSTNYHGEIGDGPTPPVKVYTIEKLPGITQIEMVVKNSTSLPLVRPKMIQELSRFFSLAWLHPQTVTPAELQEGRRTVSEKLTVLASALPPRFHTAISHAQKNLDQLYSPLYPQVLTHGDLCELNTLIMPDTGCISGLIDWAEASILPFGMALYGLNNFLGGMSSEGWKYDENREKLEAEFWQHFWNTVDIEGIGLKTHLEKPVRTARDLGVLLRYGFVWENGLYERPASEMDTNTDNIRYLDALLLAAA